MPRPHPLSRKPRNLLSFQLSEDSYALDVERVVEIRGWSPVRQLPDTPNYVVGVMEVRGEILPVVDLRLRFNTGGGEYGATTVVILVRMNSGRSLGLVVDAVCDVLELHADQIQPSPELGGSISARYIEGMFSDQNHEVLVLDTDHLLDADELMRIDELRDSPLSEAEND